MTLLTEAYIRRKRFEGQALLAAFGQAAKESGGHERISAQAMLMRMGGA